LVQAGHRPSGEYRGRKTDIWEGGHRVSFLVRWPGKVESGSVSDNLLSLNDIFATCAQILGTDLPANAAEDSFGFLDTLLGGSVAPHRDHLVSHSVGGEFGYVENGWKLVYLNANSNRDNCRGEVRTPALYHLAEDIGETQNLLALELAQKAFLEKQLQTVVERGSSRPGATGSNDTRVDFTRTQKLRWADPLP
ncbi:MAG: sulfatase-like hydrolase/transferase, partial [Verrucomicrobiae bacterium]|nr:sulfatase-like hydrolase/transferase [Verrucomicrobiae bacterium]